MKKLLKISVIYCCLVATSRKCKITLYGCHSPSQHRKPSLNFDAVALKAVRFAKQNLRRQKGFVWTSHWRRVGHIEEAFVYILHLKIANFHSLRRVQLGRHAWLMPYLGVGVRG